MPETPAPRHLCAFGFGYSATWLARRLLPMGWLVTGTCRSADKAPALAADGVAPLTFDGRAPIAEFPARLRAFDAILLSIPPDAEGDPVLRFHRADFAQAASRLRWVGYLSTTGVYGDHGGAWVDETAALRPTGPRQAWRVAAERAWLALHAETGLPVHVFRLAGIYGPGRSALDAVRAGTARRIDKAGQLFSRIHVEDIAAVLEASLARPNPGRIYNVCDDQPAPGHAVTAFACDLLGVEPPPLVPFEQATLSPMAASFYADNKRVGNQRIKAELGVTLRYPSWREGLTAIHRLETTPAAGGAL